MFPAYDRTTGGETQTLGSLLDILEGHSAREAVLAMHEDDAESWSYGELARCARRMARGLRGRGVARGDRVALLGPNRPEWIAAALAVLEAGAVATPLDAQIAGATLARKKVWRAVGRATSRTYSLLEKDRLRSGSHEPLTSLAPPIPKAERA